MFKPQLVLPVLLVLALAHEQRRRLLSGFLLTCLALGVLSLAVVGWHALLAYPAVLLHYVPENPGIIAPASMPNLRGLFYVLLSQRIPLRLLNWSVAAISAGLLAGTAVAWRVAGGRRDLFPLKMALVVTATVLVSFHGNVHDSAVLVLPILLVCNWLTRMGVNTWSRVLLAVLIAGLLLLPMISANRQVLGCITLALLVATGCELLQNRTGAEPSFSALASRGTSCGTLSG
jgi:hypothetical protein